MGGQARDGGMADGITKSSSGTAAGCHTGCCPSRPSKAGCNKVSVQNAGVVVAMVAGWLALLLKQCWHAFAHSILCDIIFVTLS